MSKQDKKIRFTTEITRAQFIVFLGMLVAVMVFFWVAISVKGKRSTADTAQETTPTVAPIFIPTPTPVVEKPVQEPQEELTEQEDTTELFSDGFRYYEIPEKYREAGGEFPEEVQAYLWSLCKERGLDYYLVVAMIERESWYTATALGDNGNSKGYMQIYEKWHTSRMKVEDVQDLYDPCGNLRVGLNFLSEIYSKHGDKGDSCVLMVYNMGEGGAKKNWAKGVYSTEYSRYILQRAEEIKQELQDDTGA